MKKNWILSSLLIICLSFALINFPLFSNAEASNWEYIGSGNLNVMETDDGYLLYPVPANYVRGLQGVKAREFKMGTKLAYQFFNNSISPLDVEETVVQLGGEQVGITQINGYAFLENRDKTQRISTGEIITDSNDGSNLWLISNIGEVKPLLDNSNISAVRDNIQNDQQKHYLIWALDPYALNHKIAYLSNRDTIINGNSGTSVHVVNEDGSNDTRIIPAEKYGPVRIIGVAKNIVAAHSPQNKSVIIADTLTGEVETFNIEGWPQSLSTNGRYILFRKMEGPMVTQNMFILNLETGDETQVTGLPDGYFYNTGGTWSPDSRLFAFYANGRKLINKDSFYRDDNLLVVVDTATNKIKSYGKPAGDTVLYPLGAIQWAGNNRVVTYSVDDTAWMLNLK